MEKIIKKILKILKDAGFSAYVVGGYPRDVFLRRKTPDIDICTSATPKQIKELFPDSEVPKEKYGAVTVYYKKVRFEITTFRKEIKYEGHRKPIEIEYIKDVKEDLLRRDFTINTFCMDEKGEIHDYLGAKQDLENKIIKTVGEADFKFAEDSLRILRAVRFSTILNFKLDTETKKSIIKNGSLLKKISYTRKKEELNRIFASKNAEKGIALLIELGLDEYLELVNLNKVVITTSILGIWSQLNVDNIYPFNKNEKQILEKIKKMILLDEFSNYDIYKYGLYVSTVASEIKGIDKKETAKTHAKLPIRSKNELALSGKEIIEYVGPIKIKEVLSDIEKKIVEFELKNNRKAIINYLKNNY